LQQGSDHVGTLTGFVRIEMSEHFDSVLLNAAAPPSRRLHDFDDPLPNLLIGDCLESPDESQCFGVKMNCVHCISSTKVIELLRPAELDDEPLALPHLSVLRPSKLPRLSGRLFIGRAAVDLMTFTVHSASADPFKGDVHIGKREETKIILNHGRALSTALNNCQLP
jgi:hypothetical protein